jgi:hypothetical protein
VTLRWVTAAGRVDRGGVGGHPENGVEVMVTPSAGQAADYDLPGFG